MSVRYCSYECLILCCALRFKDLNLNLNFEISRCIVPLFVFFTLEIQNSDYCIAIEIMLE